MSPLSTAFLKDGQKRYMAEKIIKVPPMAESIQEGTLTQWHKKTGEFVARDEVISTIETDKVDVTVNSPESGTILELYHQEGDTVSVGGNFYRIELGEAPEGGAEAPKEAESKKSAPKEEAKPEPTKEAPKAAPEPVKKFDAPKAKSPEPAAAPKPASSAPKTPAVPVEGEEFAGQLPGSRTERRVKMNRMRLRIAERLKESQETAASLTTFNEVDMSNLMEMRKKYKDLVLEKHGVKLGFMGAFIKAASAALQEVPGVNASIEGGEIVYHDYVDVSVAVATPKGLVTPVLRNCESLSMVQVEKAIAALGKKARDNQITIEDMAGGTFTVSNGGVFGSLYGTPIINLPQSAILGMHATKERAVVINGKVEVRPMMYIALTYDHRVIDGREAVTFLVKIKEIIEDPRRLLLDL
ncbi:dihydrolipoyllysine-residue succinyltransferase [Powellomyces hirtus]|uniref:dihydrolipoyllysine-residue succinyltransferase n=1 Tax=Powellomyces hirtus TaxID=109895 RepID=A0A507E9C0_9FUNG|nr:dihydrolipoyllysine-residue succinyltransferase [Powellomyces hirtus]